MLSTRHFQHRYIPARKKGEREKILVVLHGLGDSLQGYSFLPQELSVGEFSYLLLNAPDDYFGGHSWFDFQGDPAPGVRRSRDLMLKLFGELEAQGIVPGDIFLFGFSQGCLVAVDAGLRCEQVLGGICGVSGYLAFENEYPEKLSSAARQQRFLITHGRLDPVIPFDPAVRQFQRLQKLGLQIDFRVYDKDHTILSEELRDIAAWFRTRL